MVIEIKPICSLVIYIDIESNHRLTPNLAPAARVTKVLIVIVGKNRCTALLIYIFLNRN